MSEATLKHHEGNELEDLVASMTSDDFAPGEPGEKLGRAIEMHGGPFKTAIRAIRSKYDEMIAAAGVATFEEQKQFLARKGIAESPEHRRRIENAAAERIQKETTADIKPPLTLVIRDLVNEEEDRRAQAAEKERNAEAARQAEADELAAIAKKDRAFKGLAQIFHQEFESAKEAQRKTHEAKTKGDRKVREILESDRKPQPEKRWSDGSPIDPRHENAMRRTIGGQTVERTVFHPPFPELDTARKDQQVLIEKDVAASAYLFRIRQVGEIVLDWPGVPKTLFDLDVLDERLGRVFKKRGLLS